MSTYFDQRLAMRQADAQARVAQMEAAARMRIAANESAAKLAADSRKDRRAERDERRAARAAWLAEHRPDLAVYGLSVVSAGLAVPAMAEYGMQVYGPLGASLFVLSEAGSWAFALAVQARRRRAAKPAELAELAGEDGAQAEEETAPAGELEAAPVAGEHDVPTGLLTVGIAVFAVFGAALNYLHGSAGAGGSVGRGVLMALVSVAGIVAHQIVVASPPRTRAQRAEARHQRQEERRLVRARRRAMRAAVVLIAEDGTASLAYPAGAYELTRRGLKVLAVAGTDASDGATGAAGASAAVTGASATEGATEADATEGASASAGEVPVPRATGRRAGTGATRRRATGGSATGAGAGRTELARLASQVPPDDPRSNRQLAADLAPLCGLSVGTARNYLSQFRQAGGLETGDVAGEAVAEAAGVGAT